MEASYTKSSIRITTNLRDRILEKAKENHRSFSGEVQYRLEKQMEQEQPQQENKQ